MKIINDKPKKSNPAWSTKDDDKSRESNSDHSEEEIHSPNPDDFDEGDYEDIETPDNNTQGDSKGT